MVSLYTFTEVGGHQLNEDAFEVQRHSADDACWFGALADGQGGQWGGGPAARLACRTVSEAAARLSPELLRDTVTWVGLMELADKAVAVAPDAGFTTLIGFCVTDRMVCGASCGDSALLVAHEVGGVVNLTHHQFKNPPVGSGSAIFVPFAGELTDSWTALAMSDGVWKYVGWERLIEVASRLRGQTLIDALAKQARLPGSGRFQDDFTLVIVQDEEQLAQ